MPAGWAGTRGSAATSARTPPQPRSTSSSTPSRCSIEGRRITDRALVAPASVHGTTPSVASGHHRSCVARSARDQLSSTATSGSSTTRRSRRVRRAADRSARRDQRRGGGWRRARHRRRRLSDDHIDGVAVARPRPAMLHRAPERAPTAPSLTFVLPSYKYRVIHCGRRIGSADGPAWIDDGRNSRRHRAWLNHSSST